MKILVIEDEPLLADLLADELEAAGHFVIGPERQVSTALEAAGYIRPDLALVDINLLGALRGTAAARELKQWGVPSIYLSSAAVESEEDRCCAIGRIGKPYKMPAVLDAVEMAGALIKGEEPGRIPEGMQLYSRDFQTA